MSNSVFNKTMGKIRKHRVLRRLLQMIKEETIIVSTENHQTIT